jgi:hypothetical protein
MAMLAVDDNTLAKIRKETAELLSKTNIDTGLSYDLCHTK